MLTQIDKLGKVSITVEQDYWSSDRAYDKLVVVEKENECAYLSRKPVPVGTSIADREYWIKIGYNVASSEVIITTTFNPQVVTIGVQTNVTVNISLNKDVDSIIVKKLNTVIGSGSGSRLVITDVVNPVDMTPIGYEVEVSLNGRIYTRYYTLTVNQASADIHWSQTSYTFSILDTPSYPTLVNTNNLPIRYESTNTSVAIINSETGGITPIAAGTTTIKAIFNGNAQYAPITATYQLIITKADYTLQWTKNGRVITEDTAIFGEDYVTPTLIKTNENDTITFNIIGDSNIASIDDRGIVSILGVGTVSIRAYYSGSNNYNSAEARYTLTVTNIPDELIHACIPTDNTVTSNIINGTTTIESLINSSSIQNNIKNDVVGYLLDDDNNNVHTDEITLIIPNTQFFVQVFLLSNVNHKVVNYFAELGVYLKDDIETQRFQASNNNTIYSSNSYRYNDKEFKLLAILRKNPINTTILIQEIQ